MEHWHVLLDVLVLLAVALALGTICELFRQSAILGYLLAGTLLGPNALHWISNEREVETLAELGVALLLFTIGLEFSWRRLKRIGPVAFGGGSLQVVVTLALAALIAMLFGAGLVPSIVIGSVVALSSTAVVLRVLMSRAEIDSVHGTSALGILLMQDIAVVPLILIVTALQGGGSMGDVAGGLLKAAGMAAAMGAGLFVVAYYLVGPVFGARVMARNRELPVLLAIVLGLGSAWLAHRLGLSPALGAFLAGMLLGGSPFATQIRADVTPLRTLLITLFFSSVGMLADPTWMGRNWLAVLSLVVAVIAGKSLVIWPILRLFRKPHAAAVATGICLAQVGEFSFVLLAVARGKAISEDVFLLLISSTIVTLFLTPFLVAASMPAGGAVVMGMKMIGWQLKSTASSDTQEPPHDQVVVIGFGPAGQAVGYAMHDQSRPVTVIDLSPDLTAMAKRLGFHAHLGDATSREVLEHVHISLAAVVVVTLPDPNASRQVIHQVRQLAPSARLIVRARYHVYRWELELAGAHCVIDEEQQAGERMAGELLAELKTLDPDAVADGEGSSESDARD